MEVYSPAISSAAAEYLATINSKATGGRGIYGRGSRQTADEPRRAGSRDYGNRKDAGTSRSRLNGQRRATASCLNATRSRACAPSRATCCSGSPTISVVWATDRRRRTRPRCAELRRSARHREGARAFRAANSPGRSASSIRRSTGKRGPRACGSNWPIPTWRCCRTCMWTPKSIPAAREPVLTVPESAVIDTGTPSGGACR